MEIKKLTIIQVKQIYKQYLINDFPLNERRPLKKIIELCHDHLYETYGLFDNNKLIAYAFFLGHKEDIICDYFAVIDQYRQLGYGSYFLQQCLSMYKHAYLYFEVEKPNQNNDSIQEKRIRFYIKNGLIQNDIQLILYHVHYLILSNHKVDITRLKDFYHFIYDDKFYDQYIEFIDN